MQAACDVDTDQLATTLSRDARPSRLHLNGTRAIVPRQQSEIMANWGAESEPLVSICTLTFEHAAFLRQSLDSLLAQETDFPFEILIHDDASTDGTTDIVQEYVESYPKIVRAVIQTQNQYSTTGGMIAARFLFPKARGEYIALCEGDDFWADPGKLQKQVDFLRANPAYVITYGPAISIDKQGEVSGPTHGLVRDVSAVELRRGVNLNTLTTCFRNKLPEIHGDLRAARLGDVVHWSLLGEFGAGKFLSDVGPSYYRIHEGGIHSTASLRQKRINTMITFNALSAFYFRKGERDTAIFLMLRSAHLAWKIAGWREITGYILKGVRSKFTKRG